MGFSEIRPHEKWAKNKNSPLEISVCKRSGRGKGLEMRLAIRRWQLADCAFLKHDARVRILIGDGEHAGYLKVLPGGQMRLYRPGGPSSDGVLTAGFPLPDCVAATVARSAVEEFSAGDHELTLRIPARLLKAPSAGMDGGVCQGAAQEARRGPAQFVVTDRAPGTVQLPLAPETASAVPPQHRAAEGPPAAAAAAPAAAAKAAFSMVGDVKSGRRAAP